MNSIRKNILLTGPPSSGKTTIIKKVVAGLKVPVKGFYTEEEKKQERRIGFRMKSLDGQEAYLAHQDIQSEVSIRRYGVSIPNIEQLAVPSIHPERDEVIILDEIGKMECFSSRFRQAALQALDASNLVLGTITYGGDEFIRGIKNREDVELIEVNLENRDLLPEILLEKIHDYLGRRH